MSSWKVLAELFGFKDEKELEKFLIEHEEQYVEAMRKLIPERKR